MQIKTLTEERPLMFKSGLIEEIKNTIKSDGVTRTQWLQLLGSEVRKLLKILSGTLQDLHIKGVLAYEKIGEIFYGQASPCIDE
ncbi:helix-turn-helix domain-containing protein [Pedobacter steynii]